MRSERSADTTVVITSCGRQDLLERTLESFLHHNSAPIARIIVIEDGPATLNEALARTYSSDAFLWLATGERVGQIRAIDLAYARVRTPYIFHCEDDWEFYAPRFVELSRSVLEVDARLLQVYLRALNDIHDHPLFDGELEAGEARYRVLQHNWDAGPYGRWHGFAFNPGLRRLNDYKKIGSYGSWTVFDPAMPCESERKISEFYRSRGYYAAILVNQNGGGFVRHTGEGRHVGLDSDVADRHELSRTELA